MPDINRIFFVYPTLYNEGMSKEECCIPSPLIAGIESDAKNTIIVTVGMIINLHESVTIRTLIYPTGKPDVDNTIDDSGKFEHLKTNILPNGKAIFLSSLYLNDLVFSESGMYEIETTLLKDVEDDPLSGTVLDSYKSTFYVLMRKGD